MLLSLLHVPSDRQVKGEDRDGYYITKTRRIHRLLEQMCQQYLLLDATLPGSDQVFGTTLLGVHPEQQLLVLDGLSPDRGHPLLLESRLLRIRGRLEGVTVDFETRLKSVGEKAGIAFYTVDIPTRFRYLQRRQLGRLSMGAGRTSFHGTAERDPEQPMEGYVHDISPSGIGLVLQGRRPLQLGDLFPGCRVRIPGIDDLVFSMEVRFAYQHPDREVSRVGGRFLALDRVTRKKLLELARGRERKTARPLQL